MSKITFEELKNIVSEIGNIEKNKIQDESHLVNDLGFHSVLVLELLVQLEEDKEIIIPQEDAHQLGTMKDIYSYIQKNF